jgi:hypothetical protein
LSIEEHGVRDMISEGDCAAAGLANNAIVAQVSIQARIFISMLGRQLLP